MTVDDQAQEALNMAFGLTPDATTEPVLDAAPVTQAALAVEPVTPAAPAAPEADPRLLMQAQLDAQQRLIDHYEYLRQAAAAPTAPAAPAAPQYKVFDATRDSLTAEELVAYKDTLPTLDKGTRAVLDEYHRNTVAPLMQELATLRQTASSAPAAMASQAQALFEIRLDTAAPGMKSASTDPQWAAFLERSVLGQKIGRTAASYWQSQNVEGLASVWSEFTKSKAPAAAPSAKPTAAPGRTGAPTTVSPTATKPAAGELLAALQEKRLSGKMTQEAYNAQVDDIYLSIAAAASA